MLEVVVDGPTGEVPLEHFITMLSATVTALNDVQRRRLGRSEGQPQWVVGDLHSSSPTTVVKATPPTKGQPANIAEVIESDLIFALYYLETGKGEAAPFGANTLKVLRQATALVGVDRTIESLRITALDNQMLNGSSEVRLTRSAYQRIDGILEGQRQSIGSITGHVQGLTEYKGDRIKVIEHVSQMTVDVKLTPELSAQILDEPVWKKEVRVTGRIDRDVIDGRPRRVRASSIEVLDPDREAPPLTEMRGAFPDAFGDGDSVEFVRRLRDG